MADNGYVQNPVTTNLPDGSDQNFILGRQADLLVTEVHGKRYTANYRNNLFAANVNGVTIPVIASGLVSVFTLYNPPGSGVNMEITRLDYAQVVTAAVINALGFWASTAALTAAGTFTTAGTVFSKNIKNPPLNKGLFFSAYTHSGTPTLVDVITGFGATTANQTGPLFKVYDGEIILPPGIAMSLAMSTGAGTASAAVVQVEWSEWGV